MGGFMLQVPAPKNRQRPTAREVARMIDFRRNAEAWRIHAEQTGCGTHGMAAAVMAEVYAEVMPARFSTPDFIHDRVVVPVSRIVAREMERDGA